MTHVAIRHLKDHEGATVTLRGWLQNKRSSGKLGFLQVRDGSGVVQVVASKKALSDEAWAAVESV
ncbi:MAG: OB-fold nucleic acid binding domain-containing protein, partial [Acidobacteriota bacterium]